MSVSGIRDQLKTFLLAQPFVAAVYDYPEENLEAFPAILIDSAGFDNAFNDTSRNMTTYKFELYVFLSMKGTKTEAVARRQMDDMYDNLLTLFNPQVHFAGSIKTEPIRAEHPQIVDRPSQMMMGKFDIRMTFLTWRSSSTFITLEDGQPLTME
jgi:hypothetical protein